MLCQPNCSWVSAKPTDCQQGGPARGCCTRLHLLTSAHLEQLCSQSGSRCCWWVCGSGCPLTGGCVKLCLVVALSAQLQPLSPTVPLKPRDGCQGKERICISKATMNAGSLPRASFPYFWRLQTWCWEVIWLMCTFFLFAIPEMSACWLLLYY